MNLPHYLTSLHLGAKSKADVLLVSLGVIPAAQVNFYKNNSGPKGVAHHLRRLGLFVVEVKPGSKKSNHVSTLCVSTTKLNAEILADLTTFHNNLSSSGKLKDATFHQICGVLFGYPLTAIDAFSRKVNLGLDELPEGFDGHPLFRFMPSRNHWHDELSVINEWKRLVELHAPHILKQLQTS